MSKEVGREEGVVFSRHMVGVDDRDDRSCIGDWI